MHDRTRLWVLVCSIFVPSFLLYISLLVRIRLERRSNTNYAAIFYRLFFVQGVIELFMLCVYVIGKLLVRERLLGNALIMSSNDTIFPMFYYYGMVQYFFNVQIWGVIVQSVGRVANICFPCSAPVLMLASLPDSVLALINILVPLAPLCRQVLQDPVSFELDNSGNAVISVRSFVSQSNATQCIITTSVASVFCAFCNIAVLRAILQYRSELSSHRKCHLEVRLAIVGFVHLLAQCAMTAFHVIVLFVVDDQPIIQHIRTMYIIPVMMLTFVHPWMLMATDSIMRKRIIGI